MTWKRMYIPEPHLDNPPNCKTPRFLSRGVCDLSVGFLEMNYKLTPSSCFSISFIPFSKSTESLGSSMTLSWLYDLTSILNE